MLYLVVFYLLLFIMGISFGYSPNLYDEYRLFELILAFFSIFFLLKSEIRLSKITIFTLLIILFFSIVYSFFYFNIFLMQDIVLWFLSFLIFIALYLVDFSSKENKHLLSFFVLISIVPILYIFFSIYDFLYTGQWYGWQFNSGSIRIFDSYIVPVFWLILFLVKIKNNIVEKTYLFSIFLIGFALLFNGARSALLSILIPLFCLWFIDKNNRVIVYKSFTALIGAFFMYKIIYLIRNYIHMNDIDTYIIRLSSSGRYEMWLFMYEQWKETPFWGLGGGWLAENQYSSGSHAHNVWLRLIFEWGFLGCTLIGFFFYQLYSLFKSNVEPVLKMGVFAILIDATFSGNFIYPASQISCVLFLALTFSYIKKESNENNVLSKILIYLYASCLLFICLIFLWNDLSCVGCESMEGRAAPFFWEHGGSRHLQLNEN